MNLRKGFAFLVLCIMVTTLNTNLVKAATTSTVATFDDPAIDSTTPLFTIDLDDDVVTGSHLVAMEARAVGVYQSAADRLVQVHRFVEQPRHLGPVALRIIERSHVHRPCLLGRRIC